MRSTEIQYSLCQGTGLSSFLRSYEMSSQLHSPLHAANGVSQFRVFWLILLVLHRNNDLIMASPGETFFFSSAKDCFIFLVKGKKKKSTTLHYFKDIVQTSMFSSIHNLTFQAYVVPFSSHMNSLLRRFYLVSLNPRFPTSIFLFHRPMQNVLFTYLYLNSTYTSNFLHEVFPDLIITAKSLRLLNSYVEFVSV